MIGTLKEKSSDLFYGLIGDFRGSKWLFQTPESFSQISPWLDYIDDQIVLMRDGSGITIIEFDGIPHEVDVSLCEKVESVLRCVEGIVSDNISLQFQFESFRSTRIDLPSWAISPSNFMQFIYHQRVKFIQGKVNCESLPLKKHTVHLILRFEPKHRVPFDEIKFEKITHSTSRQYKKVEKSLREIKNTLHIKTRELEASLQDTETPFRILKKDDILTYLRHIVCDKRHHQTPYDDSVSLNQQIAHDFIDLHRSHVQIAEEKWECLSWHKQPSSTYTGMFSKLLKFGEDFRFTVNINRGSVSDLDIKQLALSQGSDAFSRITRNDVNTFQEDLERDSKPFSVSIHAFVKCQGDKNGFDFASRLDSIFSIPFVVESRSAAGVWLLNLPGAYGSTSDLFLERAKRCNSRHLRGYFPIFVGWKGTGGKSGGGMLMQSRAGNAVLISPQDSQTGPHVAFCASSGGGKSVANSNYKSSLLATRSDYMQNFIDLGVSYEIFARVFGEHVGSEIITPPKTNLNPFRGEMNEDRFLFLVELLATSVKSISGRVLTSNEKTLLKFSISEAYNEQVNRAREAGSSTIRSMRILDILNMMPYEAKKLRFEDIVEGLRKEFTILTSDGLYGHIFDQDTEEPLEEPPAPGITLYDLSALSSDPIQGSLSVSIILGEIFRQTTRKANKGRYGSLDIEEVGILARKYPALAEFATEAWKRFRKANISCTGLTNDPSDYATLDLGEAIWSQSENVFFLKMKARDANKIVKGEPGKYLPLLEQEHLSRTFLNLKKVDGQYADALFTGYSTGSYCYAPTGYDYWLAANKKIEKEAFYLASKRLDGFYPFSRTLLYLAKYFSFGVRDSRGELRPLTDGELSQIPKDFGLEELNQCLGE